MSAPDNQIIIHPGIVDHFEKDKVFVRILSQSACSTCHARGACSISEAEDKIIEVRKESREHYRIGEAVTVRMKQGLGKKAVMLGYVIPLIILVASIVIFVTVLKNEGLAALMALLLLVPYYGILYLMKEKLREEFNFSIYPGE